MLQPPRCIGLLAYCSSIFTTATQRGMKTLALRVRQQNANALSLAHALEAHPQGACARGRWRVDQFCVSVCSYTFLCVLDLAFRQRGV